MNFELRFGKISAVTIERMFLRMYASYGLVELYLDIRPNWIHTGNSKANNSKVIELSIKEKWSYLAKKVEFHWYLAMDPVTNFDPICRK